MYIVSYGHLMKTWPWGGAHVCILMYLNGDKSYQFQSFHLSEVGLDSLREFLQHLSLWKGGLTEIWAVVKLGESSGTVMIEGEVPGMLCFELLYQSSMYQQPFNT